MSRLQSFRESHPSISYRGYSAEYRSGTLDISFDFFLEPGISFAPKLSLPARDGAPSVENLHPYIFQLGLIELMSYWKCACPKVIKIVGKPFSPMQLDFWKLMYRDGLSEFYYVNELNPDRSLMPEFQFIGEESSVPETGLSPDSGTILMVSGGKDTACLLDLYSSDQQLKEESILFHLKADAASHRLAKLYSFPEPLLGIRTIDPQLIALNERGYFNGHTPFSAYLAFTGLLLGKIFGKLNIVVANESSANEPSLIKDGLAINHQFSKSLLFEMAFRDYATDTFSAPGNYFSVLRALNEEQICAWFSTLPAAHPLFRSCNRAAKIDSWCGDCPKCSFVALLLASFLGIAGIRNIFGKNPFDSTECIQNTKLLLADGGDKPLDCVGTYAECHRALERMKENFPLDVPVALRHIIPPNVTGTTDPLPEHCIPRNLLQTLMTTLQSRISGGA